MRKSKIIIGGTAALMLTLAGCANGDSGGNDEDTFPSEDIRVVVPYPAGGETDTATRAMAPLLGEALGVEVIVENRPGADGSIGYNWLLDQDPDGHSISMFGVDMTTLQFQGYDITPEQFKYVGMVTQAPGGIAVPADSPYETIGDLIEDAEANPGEITYAAAASGSPWDLAGYGLMEAADIEVVSVPYDGSSEAVEAAAGEHVDFVPASTTAAGPQIEGGSMRWLAMLTEERVDSYEEIPTLSEEGVDHVTLVWSSMMVHGDTPDEIVEVLSEGLVEAVESSDFQETATRAGLVADPMPYPEFGEYVRSLPDEFQPIFEEQINR